MFMSQGKEINGCVALTNRKQEEDILVWHLDGFGKNCEELNF
jgi:hypothetical protein